MLDAILDFINKNQAFSSKEERIVTKYGLELFINAIISVSVLFLIGILLHRFWETLIFYLTYLFLKKDTGGYHANSHVGCILQFNGFCLILFLLYQHGIFPICEGIFLFLLLISVFFLAPIESINKKVSFEQLQHHKQAARIKTLLICILGIVLKIFKVPHNTFYGYFYLGLFVLSMTVFLGAIQNYYLDKKGE